MVNWRHNKKSIVNFLWSHGCSLVACQKEHKCSQWAIWNPAYQGQRQRSSRLECLLHWVNIILYKMVQFRPKSQSMYNSHLSRVQVRQFKPETCYGELDIGTSLVHARSIAQHSRHFFIGSTFFVNRFQTRTFANSVDALSEKIRKTKINNFSLNLIV